MNRLKSRDILKPGGQYDRTQFLFWFCVPMACIVLLSFNTWELEKPLIRLSYFIGFPGLNARTAAQIIVILLVLFLTYLLIMALVKRSDDLDQSGWLLLLLLIPITGMFYLVYLMFWPGKTSHAEAKKPGWLKIGIMSIAAIVVFILLTMSSLLLGLKVLWFGLNGFGRDQLILRIWNRTDASLTVSLTVSRDTVFQGYPVNEIKSNEIVKKDKVLSRKGKFAVIIAAKNTAGESVYSKSISSEELAGINGIILIPGQ
jgi:uncharacterized membrane protein YhaH (DUF805 family)